MARFRNVCFTINNYTEEDVNLLKVLFDEKCTYLIYGYEVGECGTPHIQGYCELIGQLSLKRLKDYLPRAHFEKRKGNAKQASDYCKKDGNFKEFGNISKQGERKDLNELKDKLLNKELSINDIILNNPDAYHMYGRTLEKIDDLKNRVTYRTEMTKGIWYYGRTGTGKSLNAFKGYHPSTHYVWGFDTDNMWNDGYCGQETVIIDDFRGEMKYKDLLNMCDRHPSFFVKRRGKERLPFTSKLVIVTSSLHPSDIYHNLNAKDSLEQLYRRFEIVHLTGPNDETSEPVTQKWSKGNTTTFDHCLIEKDI